MKCMKCGGKVEKKMMKGGKVSTKKKPMDKKGYMKGGMVKKKKTMKK